MSDNTNQTPKEVYREEEVRALYTELALNPKRDFGWNKGEDNARALGYDPAWLKQMPDSVWESSAGVGNPFSLGPIRTGETVVDLGCGAGADACVAALLVGASGQVIGVDLTPAMVDKARANANRVGFHNITIYEADIAKVPLRDGVVDVVISNGSINLSSHKACVLKEAFRILKPGGRLYIADMVRDITIPAAKTGRSRSEDSWANCVAGTLTPDCFLKMIREAGFENAEFVGITGCRTAPETVGATFRAKKSV